MKLTILILLFASPIFARTQPGEDKPAGLDRTKKEIHAIFETSEGRIVCELYPGKAPLAVENFVQLARGEKEFLDPVTREPVVRKFYDGLKFHRVIPRFMIQGGCPLGNGMGGPGYRFQDEISDLKFDRPGRLAMANSGPNTNGSQFFITEVPTPWLDGKHTIFGQVIEGQDIVNKIARVPRGLRDAPTKDVLIKKLTIKEAKAKVLLVVAPINYRETEYDEIKTIFEREGVEVVTASTKRGELTGMDGGKASSDVSLSEVNPRDFDAVVFVGGIGASVFWENPFAHRLAKGMAADKKPVGAICIAPVTLERAGVLKGKKATVFESERGKMKSAVASDKKVEKDGLIVTASGPEAAGEFATTLLELLK